MLNGRSPAGPTPVHPDARRARHERMPSPSSRDHPRARQARFPVRYLECRSRRSGRSRRSNPQNRPSAAKLADAAGDLCQLTVARLRARGGRRYRGRRRPSAVCGPNSLFDALARSARCSALDADLLAGPWVLIVVFSALAQLVPVRWRRLADAPDPARRHARSSRRLAMIARMNARRGARGAARGLRAHAAQGRWPVPRASPGTALANAFIAILNLARPAVRAASWAAACSPRPCSRGRGLGRLMVRRFFARDLTILLQGACWSSRSCSVVINLLVDLSYGLLESADRTPRDGVCEPAGRRGLGARRPSEPVNPDGRH